MTYILAHPDTIDLKFTLGHKKMLSNAYFINRPYEVFKRKLNVDFCLGTVGNLQSLFSAIIQVNIGCHRI